VGAIAFDCGDEPLPSGYIFSRLEYIDSCAGPLNDVCQAEPPIWKTPIVLVCEWFWYKIRLKQEFPETVRVPSEVMSSNGRTEAWIDTDEEDPDSLPNVISEPLARQSPS